MDRKEHWENIYATKALNEVSWYQPKPETSLEFIERSGCQKKAKIIDVGGGDSFLVDNLLEKDFSNVSVLDISENAVERAKKRLGQQAGKVSFIVSDVVNFNPEESVYDVWHDRAAFHFLRDQKDKEAYLNAVKKGLKPGGTLIIGTFSENGPLKCSGIEIQQYSLAEMQAFFGDEFEFIEGETLNHQTPFDTLQNFSFARFKRL